MEIKTPILINIFLRGGSDGLSWVFPIKGEDREIYEAERPNLKIGATGKDAALILNENFAFHPSAKGLYDLYQKNKLAVFHATGLVYDTRSHFDAQNLIERGTTSTTHIPDSCWIARYFKNQKTTLKIPPKMPSISIGQLSPTSLLGDNHNTEVDQLGVRNWATPKKVQADFFSSIQMMYQSRPESLRWLSELGAQTLETMDILSHVAEQKALADDLEYPKTEMGNRLQVLANLIKQNLGTQVATIDMGGWDTHKYQGTGAEGTFSNLVLQLSDAVSVFYRDVGTLQPVIITIQTEFGRRLRENANRGTDHGHGGVMMVLGDSIQGGKLYGRWPGLKSENLYQRADLAVTTDYRQIFSEILFKKMQIKDPGKIFPGFKYKPELKFI